MTATARWLNSLIHVGALWLDTVALAEQVVGEVEVLQVCHVGPVQGVHYHGQSQLQLSTSHTHTTREPGLYPLRKFSA